MKPSVFGKCLLCNQEKELNFEHIPPKSAFNKSIRYYDIPHDVFWDNLTDCIIGEKKFGRKIQTPFGRNCLCEKCNGYLGSAYVKDYKKLAQACVGMINTYPNALHFEFSIPNYINLLNFIKQIVAIFICSNDHSFVRQHPELRKFVMNKDNFHIPEKYQIYMYLNSEGFPRHGAISFINTVGQICEFTYPPFGFVLSIDNEDCKPDYRLANITHFKNFHEIEKTKKMYIGINKLPTWYPLPLDYRTKNEILAE
jgi:hypothetical protein